jgi:hypothetical protein
MSMILPERRYRRRYLTLKNAAITGIALVVAFILLSIWSQLRPAHSAASGNLFESGVVSSESPSVHHGPVAIVQEGSIDGHLGTDSILIDAGTTHAADVSIATSSTPAARQKKMTISGATEGVQMHVKTAPAPVITQTSETAVPAQPGQPPQSH